MAADSPLLRFRLWRAGLPPALRLLLTLNLATYVGWVFLSIFGLGGVLVDLFGLIPAQLAVRPWTPLTYAVTNAGPYFAGFLGLIGFVFAVLWLNWLGRDFEELYGASRLMTLYVLGALAGAAFALAMSAFAPGFAGLGVFAGAWGPVAAVLCALATLHPEKSIGLLFLGVVPLRWVAVGFVVLDLAFVRDPTHLGAAALGVGFGLALRSGVDLTAWVRPLFARRAPARRPPSRSGGPAPMSGRSRRGEEVSVAPAAAPSRQERRRAEAAAATQAEVDRILDKISARGIEALTEDERRVLEEYSRRS